MSLLRPLLLTAPILLAAAASAEAQQRAPSLDCEPGSGRSAFSFSGEVAGGHAFTYPLPPGWLFALEPARYGWELRIYSNIPGDAAGVDLSIITPPFRGPNPRELYGWHFRNAGNTGPNLGDVNAPQDLRYLAFSPAIAEGETFDPGAALVIDSNPEDGHGWLRVVDYGLADLEPGEQARMVYLNFQVCLTWPERYDPPPPEPIGFEPEDIERIRACGLDPSLAPVPYLQPPLFEVDFDLDGAWDFAMPVERIADGKRAIAICRAGTWLHVIGLEGDLGELMPAYFDRMTWWRADPYGPIGQGAGQGPPPVALGDTLTIGIEDSSSVKLYWDGAAFQAYRQGD